MSASKLAPRADVALIRQTPVRVAGLDRAGLQDPEDDLEGVYWSSEWGAFKPKRVGTFVAFAATVRDESWIQVHGDRQEDQGRVARTAILVCPRGVPSLSMAKEWGLRNGPIMHLGFETYRPVTRKTDGLSLCDPEQQWVPIPTFQWQGLTAVGLAQRVYASVEEWALVTLGDEGRLSLTACVKHTEFDWSVHWCGSWRVPRPKWHQLGAAPTAPPYPGTTPTPAPTPAPQAGPSLWCPAGANPPPLCAAAATVPTTISLEVGPPWNFRMYGRGRSEGMGNARTARHVQVVIALDDPRVITISWGTVASLRHTLSAPMPYSLPLRWTSAVDAVAACFPGIALVCDAWESR